IMINLAGPSKTIYDPFCGTGTYLMEAMIMGKKAIGSDLEPRMVAMSEKNCQWLKSQFHAPSDFRVFERDARFIPEELINDKIDTIITEGYLGTPVTKTPSPEEREKTFRELANLHLNWLTSATKILKKGGKIVMCVAAFRTKSGIEHLPHFEQLVETAGYKIIASHQYERKEQVVTRDIAILEKK
ncbi:methyltransferase domain-containing protein, partial [Candidatus Parcubacteria bacterium]|nr:methyltransferase domain-containing protein [Candidatus Parcubacteria bacterium]